MTNPTTNPDLIAAIRKLDKHVPWYEWCDLENSSILDDDAEYLESQCAFVHSDPACEAAVVMYAGEVRLWFREYHIQDPMPCKMFPDEHAIAGDMPMTFVSRWYWQVGIERDYTRTQHEAAIALIIAIAASLEE